MDRILDRFGPTPETPPTEPQAQDQARTCNTPDLSPIEAAEWAASVIEQEADATETPPADRG